MKIKNREYYLNFFSLILCLLAVIITCSNCSLSKSLPEEETLYNGANIEIEKPNKRLKTSELELDLNTVISNPKPNKKILGVPLKLRLYNLFYTQKEKGLKQWLMKKLGEAPVLYQENITRQTEELLENRAINNGYFDTKVNSKSTTKNRKTSVKYFVKVHKPYLIDTLKLNIRDSLIGQEIFDIKDSSFLHNGQRYDLDIIKLERQRIANNLRKQGYYYFRDDYLLFRADTTEIQQTIIMEMLLKEEAPSRSLQQQKIRQLIIYPDYDLKRDKKTPLDTLATEEMTIIFKNLILTSDELRMAILLEKDQIYDTEFHRKTLERLSNMQTYQYIDVQFKKVENRDSLLDVLVFLTPKKKRTIEGSLGMSLTNNISFGPELAFNYINRNLFRGAELFQVSGKTTFNFPLASQVLSTEEQELEVELIKPRVWFPIRQILESKKLVGSTSFKLKFNRQIIQLPLNGLQPLLADAGFNQLLERVEMDSTYAPTVGINSLEFSFGYRWKRRTKIRHQITPVQFVFQFPQYETNELQDFFLTLSELSEDRDLALNLEQMLIYKPSYVFLFDSRLKKIKRNNYFYRGKLGFSTNRLLNNNNVLDASKLEGSFLHLEHDIRYFWQPNAGITFAFRLAPSVAYPLKNEVILPFFDLYVIGGPNSVRSFQPRRVGPGTTTPTNENFFFVGTGDIRLESSFEIRQKLTSLIEIAAFIDAGNTWLFDGDGQSDPAEFDLNNFHKELATGAGLGLRFDFSVLLIRLDLAHPLTKPWLPEGERMVKWNFNELNFNLAFGYPF